MSTRSYWQTGEEQLRGGWGRKGSKCLQHPSSKFVSAISPLSSVTRLLWASRRDRRYPGLWFMLLRFEEPLQYDRMLRNRRVDDDDGVDGQ